MVISEKWESVRIYLREHNLSEDYARKVLYRMKIRNLGIEEAIQNLDIDDRKLAFGKHIRQKYFIEYKGKRTPVADILKDIIDRYKVPYKLVNCEVLFYQRIKNHKETPEQAIEHIDRIYKKKYGARL